MCNMAIQMRIDTPIVAVSHPTNERKFLTDYDSNMMPLWFSGDCMPKVLIDNNDLSDSDKYYNDYVDDFVINAEECNVCYNLNGPNKLKNVCCNINSFFTIDTMLSYGF